MSRRGEIVEDVDPPLRLDTPLLLVKPPVGLSTPAVFRALDLNRRSQAEPLQVLPGTTRPSSSTRLEACQKHESSSGFTSVGEKVDILLMLHDACI